MKKIYGLLAIITILFVAVSCESLARTALDKVVSGSATAPSSSSGFSGTTSKAIEFQADDVLATVDTGEPDDCSYFVVRIITPASAASKNQAEALFIKDGSKAWVNRVTPSRKAEKSDFKVGATVLFAGWLRDAETTDQDYYRKCFWNLGYITSVDELYKNRIEVAGDYYNIAFLRVPTGPVK